MLRTAILATARSARTRSLIETMPMTRSVVSRFVAGAHPADAVRVTRSLLADGRRVSLDHLGEDTAEPEQASATVDAYLALVGALADEGLAAGTDLSVKLSAVGQNLPADGEKIALENARRICAAAD